MFHLVSISIYKGIAFKVYFVNKDELSAIHQNNKYQIISTYDLFQRNKQDQVKT